MHYDISQPVDNVFNTIDNLADLAEQAESPMTAQQQINLAYVIFARQPILQQIFVFGIGSPPLIARGQICSRTSEKPKLT